MPAEVTPESATKDHPFENSLGMKFVPVRIMGGPSARQRVLFSIWETRRQDYATYAAATNGVNPLWEKAELSGLPIGQGLDHPVVCISFEDARDFCAWLTAKDRMEGKLPIHAKYRVPTDEEWSCAEGIGDQEDAGKTPKDKNAKITDAYPWGYWPPKKNVGNYDSFSLNSLGTDRFDQTSPVGSFSDNQYGLFDLGGNVWEWCEDYYDGNSGHRVLRGASWCNAAPAILLSSCRLNYDPGRRDRYIGFRCVLALSAR